jgi:hypothetical protein
MISATHVPSCIDVRGIEHYRVWPLQKLDGIVKLGFEVFISDSASGATHLP